MQGWGCDKGEVRSATLLRSVRSMTTRITLGRHRLCLRHRPVHPWREMPQSGGRPTTTYDLRRRRWHWTVSLYVGWGDFVRNLALLLGYLMSYMFMFIVPRDRAVIGPCLPRFEHLE